ncbi:MAG: M20/M25/M40 family metallo-hydrolase [Cyclobacteriaceae bacterium]|nr:M20/M25/M40 family metallo-hydrolase [Cyclobacteriaceae bacterium]
MKHQFIFAALLFIGSPATWAQSPQPGNILAHVSFLASDELQGRGTGTEGERMAAKYIESKFKKLKLKPYGDNKTYRQQFDFKGGMHGTGEAGKAMNLVGYLDNGAPTTVIIGAHYDHLGMGNQGSSLDPNPAGKIHNGADDNASGVAGLLELARYLKTNKVKEKNNFLFLCFSGEELGLYGSDYFVEHPTIDLASVNYMINLDMVGRLDPKNGGLSVSGSGTSPGWEPLLKKLSTQEVPITTDSSGTGPSDHTKFYLKKIPVLHFFTGSHSDYHKPSDDADKINAQGEVAVLKVIINVIEQTDTQPKLAYLTTKSKSMGGSRSFKVTMGVMPSYSSKAAGLKVDGVSEGKPAQKAGILAGDIIIQIGELSIKDIESYMDALGKFEKGQTVPVKLLRAEKEMTVNVTF